MTEPIGIIGGGIVGVALARALAMRGEQVTLLEKERRLAQHQTGHNSGVVHAGIYYAPGSLKATLCARGRTATRDYCLDKKLPYAEVGKLVVAVSAAEIPAIDELERRSVLGKVPGLRRLRPEEIREIEPYTAGVAALHSSAYRCGRLCRNHRGVGPGFPRVGREHIQLAHEVTGMRIKNSQVTVVTSVSEYRFRRVNACAGLQSDVIARFVGAYPSPRILPLPRRGTWSLRASRAGLVRGMIYPVPDPQLPVPRSSFHPGRLRPGARGPERRPGSRQGGLSLAVNLRRGYLGITALAGSAASAAPALADGRQGNIRITL